ncbi:MAG: site-specific integrase [bacterium]|nr:site-specific integrase [bacterium]
MKGKKLSVVSLQTLVQDFFEKYLAVERHVSRHTVLAYRDCLKLFLRHAAERFGCTADQLDCAALDVEVVRSFLGWLQTQRKCGARTRNHRLAAIKSFARYVASVAPEHLERCRRIRELRPASFEHPEIEYLDDDEVLALLRAIDPITGRRDRALLLLLYNTGARVQELVDLDVADFSCDPVALITLQGKGRKQRTCPLWPRTVDAINAWLEERSIDGSPLFLNAHGRRLSRSGVAHILRTLAKRAGLSPRHAKHVTPHVIRHTTAMHLLQSGVDITTIAAWLGHSQLATTHAYVEINLRMKQKAIAAADTLPELSQGTYPQDDLIAWLAKLGRSNSYVQKPPSMAASLFSRGSPLHITDRST